MVARGSEEEVEIMIKRWNKGDLVEDTGGSSAS